ncbi:MAG: hypothetical protein KBB83_08280, partial [Alphaproteobacteria bacterium]|nr:hypothetical protein [Alphaproteobacteria bacterium]
SQLAPLHCSARGATLGNGGWLTLSMPGLSPDQMRPASRRANAANHRRAPLARPVDLTCYVFFQNPIYLPY